MSYVQDLKALLEPMGVYRLEGSLNGGALTAAGEALDQCGDELAQIQREMLLTTAESWGLSKIEALLTRRPVTENLPDRRAALAALLRIGGDSFTLQAINDNLRGCGLNAVAEETGVPGEIAVRFPDVPGIPDGFDEMKGIIEEILPCHLGIEYRYWYITWEEMETRFDRWSVLDGLDVTWEELEKMVERYRLEGAV